MAAEQGRCREREKEADEGERANEGSSVVVGACWQEGLSTSRTATSH